MNAKEYLINCKEYIKETSHELYNDFLASKEQFKDNKMKHLPNILSALRVLAVPVVAGAALAGNVPMLLWVSGAAILTDKLDGTLATNMNAKSKLGSKLDPFADKLLIGTLCLAAIANIGAIALIPLALEAYITKINTEAHPYFKDTKTCQMGRLKTLILYPTLFAVIAKDIIPAYAYLPMIGAGLTASVGLQLATIKEYKKIVKQMNRDNAKELATLCHTIGFKKSKHKRLAFNEQMELVTEKDVIKPVANIKVLIKEDPVKQEKVLRDNIIILLKEKREIITADKNQKQKKL